MITYNLKIEQIRQETEDTITLCFKQPGLKKIKYLAGQYLTLIFRINGRRYIRPYSFSSTPLLDPYLEVTIKRVPNGIISNHIHDMINVGDSVQVMPPMGDFILPELDVLPDSLFFWGVGSGITPLMSLIKQALNTTDKPIYLIYGNRTYEKTIFLNLIKDLQDQYPERFMVYHFHTQLSVTAYPSSQIQGRITSASALSILSHLQLENSLHYICGPAGLKESVKDALTGMNISSVQILSEDFELVKNPADFEDIHTELVSLIFEGAEHKVEVAKGKSILESALDAGIELPYSCQTGNCSMCKGILKNGTVKTIGLVEEREDLLIDEYLLCCSHPLSKDVIIAV